MASTTPRFRYSNGQIATAEAAQAFSWEEPVPVNAFWDTIDYCPARNFLGSFSDDELSQLPIEPNSTEPTLQKLQLLLRLLQAKLAREEASTTPPNTLHAADYTRWYNLWQAIYAFQSALGLLPEAEQTVRMLASTPQPAGRPRDVRPAHILAEHLVKVGKYAEAEAAERPVLAWMDAQRGLGPGSPQGINARKFIVRAVWGQGEGRRAEAEGLLRELEGIVEGMKGGRFAVYQEEERRAVREMREELERGG